MSTSSEPTLYGVDLSQPVRSCKLLFSLNKDFKYTYKVVDLMKGEQKTDEYKKNVNPAGKVPALVHGDFKLSEGAAILGYLGEQKEFAQYYGDFDVQQRAKVNQWMHWMHTTLRMKGSAGIFQKAFFQGKKADELKDEIEAFNQVLQFLDDNLAQNKFVIGDKLTIGDLFLVPEVDQLKSIITDVVNYDSFKNVNRWLDDIESSVPGYAQNLKDAKTIFDAAMNAKK
mmetsp:Transcript_2402/g.3512  ORF Transcript_2402/g.3512 Transcript_2402/m.3512 type:complete len:227 (-) Transcript_2402:29-709(-)